ncbi:N,N-dimethylglycine oxidase [Kwoniella heveanensis BCC8398]|uniref:N,N-dimethylglycine oxidase n=1 Tax=Kwoniella heveanensis BCC8398 TaxID=1296120 RepID=A0A1B9GIS3_9TREE|nr:N,N-dimethylglycine oxidase [Kwoniella heveanensis BCC8398]
MSLPSLNTKAEDRIVIIGAGIVGSHLASFLASSLGDKVILVDRDIRGLPGSTGHAPGFVGQYNELPVLTELAKRSVNHYANSGSGGFDRVGGLEVGPGLEARAEAARQAGLPAKLLNKQEILELAPGFVREDSLSEQGNAGLLFPLDGTAKARVVTHAEQDSASKHGAVLINTEVLSVTVSQSGRTIDTSLGAIEAGRVVFCTGIWASQLLPQLEHTVVSVAHPYSYSTPHAVRPKKTPFIRWPARHVYARDHGEEDGLGSYAHAPIKHPRGEHAETAYGKWEDSFDEVLANGYALLPNEVASTFMVEGGRKFNGLFSVTPDGLPLVGKVEEGIYAGVGVWVTHAAGSARLLADELLGKAKDEDEALRKALDPRRFDGQISEAEQKVLEQRALAKYNDIYNKDN